MARRHLPCLIPLRLHRLTLSAPLSRICRGTLLYSAFANWLFTILAGILGASEATPIAGAGHHAAPGAEQAILAGLVSVVLAMLVAVVLLLMGLRRSLRAATVPATA